MADLGKVTPTKPAWSRTGEPVVPEEKPSHPRQHPEKDEEKEKRDSDETSEQHKPPSDPDDEHEIDLFV